MRSSDTPASNGKERLPGWESEEGSDNAMDERILIQVKESSEHLYEQEEEPADRRGP